MSENKQQTVETDNICKKVLTDIFGDGSTFSCDEYDLLCGWEQEPEALCLNAAADGQDIADQIHFSGKDVGVNKILFGVSKYDNKEIKDD